MKLAGAFSSINILKESRGVKFSMNNFQELLPGRPATDNPARPPENKKIGGFNFFRSIFIGKNSEAVKALKLRVNKRNAHIRDLKKQILELETRIAIMREQSTKKYV